MGGSRTGLAILAAFKAVAFSYLFANETWEWCCKEYSGSQYLSYLTYQGMWMTIIYLAFSLAVCALQLAKWAPATEWERHAWLHLRRASQVMLDISTSWELLILLLYWLAIFDNDINGSLAWYRNINQHVITFVLITADFCITCARIPDRHTLIAFGAAIVYCFWNLGYTKTVKPVYSILKWNDGGSAALCLGALAGVAVFCFAYNGLAIARDRWAARAGITTLRFTDERASTPCVTCGCTCCVVANAADGDAAAAARGAADAGYGATRTSTAPPAAGKHNGSPAAPAVVQVDVVVAPTGEDKAVVV